MAVKDQRDPQGNPEIIYIGQYTLLQGDDITEILIENEYGERMRINDKALALWLDKLWQREF